MERYDDEGFVITRHRRVTKNALETFKQRMSAQLDARVDVGRNSINAILVGSIVDAVCDEMDEINLPEPGDEIPWEGR